MTQRTRRIVVAGMLACVWAGLAGCAGTPPTAGQIAEENRDSQVAQIMRVAETTRRGGDLISAVGLYRRAHDLAPERGAPLIALGDTLLALGAFSDAAQAYGMATAREPSDVDLRYGYGRTLLALNRPREAAEQFRAAIAANSKDGRAFNGLGVALDQAGDHDAAQQAYVDGLEVAPDHPGLANNLAFSMLLSGDFADAVVRFEQIARQPQATARNRQNLALAYGLAGDVARATMVAAQDLSEAEVRNNLAAFDRLRRLAGAERNAELLRLRDSRSAQVH
jgi:Flp pilus assembly protein TadD